MNFLHDSFGAMGYLQFNIVNNSLGNAVALDSTDDTYDSGYFANGLEYQFRPQATTSRGNLATRITKGFQQTLSNGVVGQVLCSNTYAYDNACNRISNTVSTAAVNGSGAVQYSGGAPSYGASVIDTSFDYMGNDGGNLIQPNSQSGNVNYFNSQYSPVTNQDYTTRTENYTYDDLNRLSTVSYGDGESQTYSFDAMGNRLGRTDTITPQTGSPATTTSAPGRGAALPPRLPLRTVRDTFASHGSRISNVRFRTRMS